VPVAYRGRQIEVAFRADLIVEDLLLIELKAVEALLPVHKAQAITYLKLLRLPLGLLVNFNVPLIKDGIKRVINSPSP
jgi:GxxExxY protein